MMDKRIYVFGQEVGRDTHYIPDKPSGIGYEASIRYVIPGCSSSLLAGTLIHSRYIWLLFLKIIMQMINLRLHAWIDNFPEDAGGIYEINIKHVDYHLMGIPGVPLGETAAWKDST